MKIKEISAPKSTGDVEGDAIKRQQKQLADRKAQIDVQKTEKRLIQQRKKASVLRNPSNPAPNSTPR